VVFLMVVCGALTVHCSGGFAISSGFLYIFFFFILRCTKHRKIFSEAFFKCKQTP
jgi:hypothetical protein